MLDGLVATIETLRGRIKEHRSYLDLARPEARTRVSLIDPLLRALEWDVSDPSLVEIEPIVASGLADYALLRGEGEPVLLLEAKRLSDTKAHHGQLASYVVGENLKRAVKIPYCAVTNGSRWQVFDVFTQECVLDASVEHEPARRCALKLIGLWQPALREVGLQSAVDLSGQVAAVRSGDARGGRRPDTVAPSDGQAVDRPTLTEVSDLWLPLDSETMSPSRHVSLSAMRLPDGSVVEVGNWREVVRATAQWLLDAGLLDRGDMPFSVGGVRYCVTTNGRRRDGKPLEKPMSVGETGIQLEGNLVAAKSLRFAIALLKRSGQSPSQAKLKLAR